MSSPVTVHVALMPSVIGCRGSTVFRSASPQGRGRRPVSYALSFAPRMMLYSSGYPHESSCAADPWNHTMPLPSSCTKRRSAASVSAPNPTAFS